MSNNKSLSFQEKVWKEIKKIKKGNILSYKQIAESIGLSRAYRAVGNAWRKNSYLDSVPYHRVIKNNGDLVSYRGIQNCNLIKQLFGRPNAGRP